MLAIVREAVGNSVGEKLVESEVHFVGNMGSKPLQFNEIINDLRKTGDFSQIVYQRNFQNFRHGGFKSTDDMERTWF
jgi:hypothetical protein